MITILVGIALLVAGMYGMIAWFPEFLGFVKGMGPVTLVIGGFISILMGIASFRPQEPHERKKKK